MKSFIKTSLMLAALGTAAAVAAAPVYLIDATTDMQAPDPSFANVAFSLIYEDFNFDMLFSLNELLAFTGYIDVMGNYFPELLAVPTVSGIAGNGSVWQFGDGQNTVTFDAATFTAFTQSAVDIPLPASPLLAGLGLVAVAALSRRRSTQP